MAETLALPPAQDPPAQDPEALLDAAAIRDRFEQLLMLRRGDEEVPAAAVRVSRCEYEVDLKAVDAWDSSADALGSEGLDAYMEWLRKEVSLAEEENCKLSAEIGVIGETVFKDTIQLDADVEALESSLHTIDSEEFDSDPTIVKFVSRSFSQIISHGLKHLEESPINGLSVSTDSCRNQTNDEKDYKYEVLELDHQIGKGEMDLRLLEIQSSSMQRAEAVSQLQSMLSGPKVLDSKGNCLRVFLNAPILASECVIYGQKLDCAVDSFVSDHELLIEFDEGSMELKKVQIFPDDVCVDILIEKLKSSRKIISVPSLGWLIRQCQHHIIINTLRRSLVNDANNSRHSFEYFDKDETIVAHLIGGIDAFIKISADWPLSSYGLKLISIRNSGTQPINITLNLLCKTKEFANGLELQTRQHLVRFVDAVEEILIREMQSELHSSSSSG